MHNHATRTVPEHHDVYPGRQIVCLVLYTLSRVALDASTNDTNFCDIKALEFRNDVLLDHPSHGEFVIEHVVGYTLLVRLTYDVASYSQLLRCRTKRSRILVDELPDKALSNDFFDVFTNVIRDVGLSDGFPGARKFL